jgi:hypothetical protein
MITTPTKNADGYTFKELYDAAAEKETEIKPMTDFTDWYERTPKNHPATRKCLEAEMRKAYEAGAASQSETPYEVTIKASELNAPAIHIQNDAGDWAKIEYDGAFTCSNPDAVTELAELFWNHLATLGPLFGVKGEKP